MRAIGFSTGALALGDFRHALEILARTDATAVELSALRQPELESLLEALPDLDLSKFSHISVHLPSSIEPDFEARLLYLVREIPSQWPLITHPNIITLWDAWKDLGDRVCIENMDKRKEIGQKARHLRKVFERLPEATFCFDIGHAHQVDPTMGEAVLILEEFRNRLVQLHVSEVNSESRHDPISREVEMAFEIVSTLIPESIPAILESKVGRLDPAAQVMSEMELVKHLLSRQVEVVGD